MNDPVFLQAAQAIAMPKTYLTDEELERLTDRKQAKKQCAWLDARRWPYETGDSGHPKVLRAYHDARMTGQVMLPRAATTQPNFGAFRARKTQAA